ncbi:hypothetical protein PR202_ga18295 [Eleusine coracana subsp. coracana]|uniref:At3g05675-like ankyrin-like domain-containing protein n=1 Tax=Eleusine coracana subsp. coracana TaxID=191504 RepID=A0AAV5CTE3_ELECO|nr:hypothetical protein PR202_ga18295 [Eleusine coracana subsp. coracana]
MSRKEAEPAGGDESSQPSAEEGGSGSGGELAEALARRRLYREVTLALQTGLRDAKADFSFLRARGLRSLLGFLRSTASATDDATLLLFRHSQSIPDLQGAVEYISQPRSNRARSVFGCPDITDVGLTHQSNAAFVLFLAAATAASGDAALCHAFAGPFARDEHPPDSFDSVKSAIGVLRASISFGCELITKCCIEYIEAASWDENEEEEILELARSLGPEAVLLLARLQAPSADAVKNVFISAIRFATGMETLIPPFLDDLKTSAQEQIDFMIHEDSDTALVTMDDDVRSVVQEGLKKLLSALRIGLDLLSTEFDQSPDQAEQKILCRLADIDWIANLLTKIEMMHDFVSGWSSISDHVLSVIQDKKYSSGLFTVKAKLIEVTGKALDAVGYGSVVLPASSRVHFLKTWLPYIQMTKLLLDGKTEDDSALLMDSDLCQSVESAIVAMVLALPSGDQADILAEWMNKAEQFRYPDLTEAFEVWCYRSKTAKRRVVGGLNGAGNPTVSL